MTIDDERALRDKMVISLEKGRNSLRPLTEIAYQYKATFFLDELRKINDELSILIDKIRSSPSGVERKQITNAAKFDAIYIDSCELVSDQVNNLYGKIIEARLNFQPFIPEVFALRKIVVDLQNTYGGRMNALNQANLTAYSIKKKLNRDDMTAMGETLEDLRQIAQQNDEVANKLTDIIISQAPELSKQMEALRTSAPKTSALSNVLQKWDQISGIISKTGKAVTGAKTVATSVLEIAALLSGIALPAFPVVAIAAKTVLGIISRLT